MRRFAVLVSIALAVLPLALQGGLGFLGSFPWSDGVVGSFPWSDLPWR
jgi:hypothetical protein